MRMCNCIILSMVQPLCQEARGANACIVSTMNDRVVMDYTGEGTAAKPIILGDTPPSPVKLLSRLRFR